ncbi:hypothetical protein SAMN04515671_3324 [Nakamurella panacisegetis]|uniref:Uncharacterized protein n=1 Tax=Nakamurella panacisegetis TaxID=1090615 RepID=A0A1H0QZ97_9ACTN|nr:hypothetical protein [Nakamurella panacisegetis]SDP22584.1 hypothetical protein SAMN04515671_3324 [Nakamurella panacisegetis]
MTGAIVLVVLGVALAGVAGMGLARATPGRRLTRRSAGPRTRAAIQLYLGALLVAAVGGTWLHLGVLGVPVAVVPVVLSGAVPILLHNRRFPA